MVKLTLNYQTVGFFCQLQTFNMEKNTQAFSGRINTVSSRFSRIKDSQARCKPLLLQIPYLLLLKRTETINFQPSHSFKILFLLGFFSAHTLFKETTKQMFS